MLLLIDEVIGRAPEYNETGLVGVPLNAVLDWCMGTPAGFAAFRHDADQRGVPEDPQGVVRLPVQPQVALRHQRLAAGLEVRLGPEVDGDRAVPVQAPREALGLRVVERLLHPAVQAGPAADRRARRRQGDRQRLRVDAVCPQDEREAARTGSGSRPSPIRSGTCWPATSRPSSSSAGRSTRRSSTPTTTTAGTARSRARSARRSSGRGRTTPRPSRRARTPRARRGRRATWRTSRRGRSSSSRPTTR